MTSSSRPSIISVAGPGGLSRRALFTHLGSAGFGLVVLGACGGSSDGTAAQTTPALSTEGAEDEPADTPAASTTAESDVAGPTDESIAGQGGGGEGLQLQHVSLGFVSAFILLRGREAAVVDTGQSGSASAILDGLSALGASWSDVQHVVLTHNHGDHAGGLAGVLEAAPGATVYAGDADLGAIESSATLQAIGDGDEVLGLGVFNTPGHTAGSISLFDTESGILVAGDALTGQDGRLVGPDADFSADMATAQMSVAKLAALAPTIAAFGHVGAPIDTDVAAQLAALAAG